MRICNDKMNPSVFDFSWAGRISARLWCGPQRIVLNPQRAIVVFRKLGSLGSSMKKLYYCRHGRMLSVVITRKGLLYLLRRESGRSRAGARWNGRNGIGMGFCGPLLDYSHPRHNTAHAPCFSLPISCNCSVEVVAVLDQTPLARSLLLSLACSLSNRGWGWGCGMGAEKEEEYAAAADAEESASTNQRTLSLKGWSVSHPLSTPLLC